MYRFSRSQLGVILLLGAAMLLLWAWRGHFGLPPATATPPDKTAGKARPAMAAPEPRTMTRVFVEVAGSVPRPGVYTFPHPPTLSQVLARAGAAGQVEKGETELASGARVEVTGEGRCRLGLMRGEQLMTLGLALDLNKATAADLDALPGIGPALAQRIIAYRQAHGPFQQIGDLVNVSGIGPKKLAKLKPYVIIEEKGK